MRDVRRALWLSCGLLLASPLSAQVYLRLEPGTWAVGGVGDLADPDRSLVLMPEVCHQETATVTVSVGFEIAGEFTELDVAGYLKGSKILETFVQFRNPATGQCDLAYVVEGADSSFLLEGLPVDSAIYRDSRTSVIELCLKIRSSCGPPPTDEDAVAVQDLSIGPKGGGL